MEYKRIWLPYHTQLNDLLYYAEPCDDEDTEKADKEIADHLKNGWRIASVAPITGSGCYDKNGLKNFSDSVFTYTVGLEVFLVKD